MQYALAPDGSRISARYGVDATCPQCSARMIAKCGDIVIHHWAHEAQTDCDPWWEPESEWHRYWKELAAPDRREVPRTGHRADIVRSDGVVVELQHSSISPAEIKERERAYSPMIWLVDARDVIAECRDYDREQELLSLGYWSSSVSPETRLILKDVGTHFNFRWKHPRKHYGACEQPVYMDLGDGRIFNLRKLWLNNGPPYGGWGKMYERDTGFSDWLTR